MQEDSANDLKMLQEWFETNRIRETGIVENVQKQPASPERDEMLEICKGNIEEFTMMIQLVASIIEREKEQAQIFLASINVKGIGEITAEKLLKKFKTADDVFSATEKQISKISGLSKRANLIWRYLDSYNKTREKKSE